MERGTGMEPTPEMGRAAGEWWTRCPPVTVPISALRPSDSPRLAGESGDHVRALAESDAVLPPVLVHRATMRVVDGMHRLRAAVLRGEQAVRVQYLDCDEAEAFVLGVRANVTHGLPLSLADRRVAAMRIITSYPQWSDRAIAAAAGLSAKTVGAIRWCATGDSPQSHSRVGRDGRVRPLSSAEGRRQASAIIRERPGDSLRQIASASGVSPGTVRDVRERMARGEDPVRPRRRQRDRGEAPVEPPPERTEDELAELLSRLKHDPSLRGTEVGRALLRLLGVNALTERDRRGLLDAVPEHCRATVAELAHACAKAWQNLADCLDG